MKNKTKKNPNSQKKNPRLEREKLTDRFRNPLMKMKKRLSDEKLVGKKIEADDFRERRREKLCRR